MSRPKTLIQWTTTVGALTFLVAACSAQPQPGPRTTSGNQPTRITVRLCDDGNDGNCLPCADGKRLDMSLAGGRSARVVETQCTNVRGNSCPNDPGAQVEWHFVSLEPRGSYRAVIENAEKQGERGNSPDMYKPIAVPGNGPQFTVPSGEPTDMNWSTGGDRSTATWRYRVRLEDAAGDLVGCADPQLVVVGSGGA